MAKKRKLEAPKAADLSRMEADFEAGGTALGVIAPIAKVAADAASESDVLGPETRARLAEAEAASEKGLVMREIPIGAIKADELVRDRAVLDREEMEELKASIVKNGVRLPIEVFPLDPTEGGFEYGLISGYRRLLAVRECWEFSELPKFATIKAIVRPLEAASDSLAAMVEENEVRASLSPFERGRIASVSAQSGVYDTIEAAVDALFPFASKAKRSKVRSFAMIFEELGDMLRFPEALNERQGLRIAAALRGGHERMLRDALDDGAAVDAASEWDVLERALAVAESGPKRVRGGGRKSEASLQRRTVHRLPGGITAAWVRTGAGGYSIELTGQVDASTIHTLLSAMEAALER